MNEYTPDRRDHRLAIGFVLGTAVGAGLMMWLAPRAASELRQRVKDSTSRLGRQAQSVRDDVAVAVARGAQEVGRFATGTMTGV